MVRASCAIWASAVLATLPSAAATVAAEAGWRSGHSGLTIVNGTIAGVGWVKSPFNPSPIIDPSSEINCDDYACDGSNKLSCKDFRFRLCDRSPSLCGDKSICLHKGLWPLTPEDVIFLFVMFAVAFAAGAPGIGGGGINVPVLMMLNHFNIKEAVPLSHVAVMGNAVSQLAVNTRLAHPDSPKQPLINYELAALLLPAMLGGNSLGVVVGRVFPPTVLIVFSLVLLAMTSAKTFHKGLKVMRANQPAPEPPTGFFVPPRTPQRTFGAGRREWPRLPSGGAADGRGESPHGDVTEGVGRSWSGNVLVGSPVRSTPDFLLGSLRGVGDTRRCCALRVPWKAIALMGFFLALFCADYVALSTDVSGVKRCTPLYWAALLALYPCILASLVIAVRMLRARAQHNSQAAEREVSLGTAVGFCALATVVGLVSGLLGLGGGEFTVPLLLEFGQLPRAAAATSGFLLFFNTTSNVVHYLMAGTMEPFLGYSIACFLVAMLGSFCGLIVGNLDYVKRRSHLLVFLVADLLFASGVLLAFRGFSGDIDWNFHSFCS